MQFAEVGAPKRGHGDGLTEKIAATMQAPSADEQSAPRPDLEGQQDGAAAMDAVVQPGAMDAVVQPGAMDAVVQQNNVEAVEAAPQAPATTASEAVSKSNSSILRGLVLPIYVPQMLQGTLLQLAAPILPLYLHEKMEANEATTGAIVSMIGLGGTCTSAFAGVIIARVGERLGMLAGIGLIGLGATLCGLSAVAPWLWVVAVGQFCIGVGVSFTVVSRMAFIAAQVPKRLRGRANSVMGGVMRVSGVVGPLSGGIIAQAAGQPSVFWSQLVVAAAAFAVVGSAMPSNPSNKVTGTTGGRRTSCCAGQRPAWLGTLLQLAPAGFVFMLVRTARVLLIPLRARDLGLSDAEVGAATATTFFADAVTFPLAGLIMDSRGRKWAGVPSLLLQGVGMAVMAYAESVPLLVIAAVVLGVGNGLSSGLVMTIMQDAAPAEARSEFIGAFKLVNDLGQFSGPLLTGFIAYAASLKLAALVIGFCALVGALWFGVCVPESLERKSKPTQAHTRLKELESAATVPTAPEKI